MKLVEKKLENIIKNSKGRMIGIGVSKNVIKMIEKNESITHCDLLNSYTKKGLFSKGKEKTFNIKDLRKKYKKNKIDFMIVNYEEVSKYSKTFIRDSIYICKENIYIFNKNESVDKYNRYNTVITGEELLEINTKNAKTNYLKDKFYYVSDTVEMLIDSISDFLTM